MIPYIKSVGENTISCNCDLIILDNNSPILISLFDYGIKTRKITADIVVNDYKTKLFIKDREYSSFEKELNTYNYGDNGGFNFKSDKQGELTHTIIKNKKIKEGYIVDWNNIGLENLLVNYLRNSLYIPVTNKIISKIIENYKDKFDDEYGIIKELQILTDNSMFENLKAYKINTHWIKQEIQESSIETISDGFDWNEIETIEDYIYKFINPIKDKISETVRPLYNSKSVDMGIFEGIKPYKGQIPLIQSTIEVLKKDSFVYMGAEMGVGKTLIGIKANHNYLKSIGKHSYETFIVAPAITLTQWKEEIERAFTNKADIIIIKKTEDFIKWYKNKDINKPTYILIGKETFKLSYATSPSYNIAKRMVEYKELNEWGFERTKRNIRNILVCPNCGKPLKNPNRTTEDIFFEKSDFKKPNKGNYKCSECKTVLWSATYNKTKKTSVIDYIHRKGIKFDSIILDEAHESNNSGSIIGNATRTVLRNHTKKVIALSGTNNNGYASSLHNLFMALCPNKLIQDGCLDVKDFVKKYGTLQAVTPLKDERRNYYSRGKAEIKDSEFKEIEGINPIVFTKYLASNSIFATLDDLKDELPEIKEMYIPIKPLEQQYYATRNLFEDIKKANCFNAKMYIDSIVKHYINNLTNWDSIEITNGDNPRTVQPQNLYIEGNLPKEDKLIEIVKQEHSEGRKVWIYTDFNNGGGYMKGTPIPKKLKKLLEDEGLKVFLLSTSTSTYDRRDVIEKNKDEYDVFICNPRLVNVGINLVFCPTYIFYMPSYRVDVISQASRRGYRINSLLNNRVYHLYYEGTIEDEIIKRYQRKLAESNAINGKFNIQLEDDKKIRTASQFSSKLNQGL